ncbi:uncharacterized protein LOC130743931 [Lotus japonicus]|uniref:uncharacterized protein LOC130743931 n=1 Tax=Lotus japonicus TaxID=34305 RepID=UPI00258A0FE6|nr:uncharacterized protein LOC130743931 [Lotus japonicus]
MSKVQNKEPTNVPHCENVTDEEEINDGGSPVKSSFDVVPDVETSVSQEISDQENPGKDSTSLEDSGNATQPDVSVSSSSKDADPKYGNSEDTNTEEPIQAPAPVQDISDDDSDDVLLTNTIPSSVSARMKRKRRFSTPEVTPTPPKRSKSSIVTYKSRQASVKGKGKQKAVKTPSEKKKRKTPVDESLVRAECVVFSPAVINQALGRSAIEFADNEVSMNAIAKELTVGHVKKWPHKKLLSTGNLSVKYAILNRIGAHTLKHADTCAVKLPEVSKALQETIRVITSRKLKVDALLLKLQEEERQGGEQSAAATAAQNGSKEEEEGSDESAEESGEESSSED